MKRGMIVGMVLLVVAVIGFGGTGRARASPASNPEATIAALQTQVAQLATQVAQLAPPVATTAADGSVTEARPIQRVAAVDLETIGTLTIRQGPVESLTVTAEASVLPKISTEVVGDTLTIAARASFTTDQPVSYALTVTTLRAVTAASSGRIAVGPLHAPQLQVIVRGSGDVALADFVGTDLQATLSGSGSCTAAGTVAQQTIALSGAGAYHGEGLASQSATVVARGSGSATLRVSDRLDVQLSGSGGVAYIGSPQLSQAISGSGRLHRIG